MEDRVTLMLQGNRVEASRERLSLKSEYFASLFSPNFSDAANKEYHVNYDIDLQTLKVFVAWSWEDDLPILNVERRVKPSLIRYADPSGDYDGLLQLLQLSVLFAAESLSKDLTEFVICHWLTPDKCLQIWQLSKELNLTTTRDVAYATCLDRIPDLPISSIVELSREDFACLLGNVHARVTEDYLLHLVISWNQHNNLSNETDADNSEYPFSLLKQGYRSRYDNCERSKRQRQDASVQCVVGHKYVEEDGEKTCIFAWNNYTFKELVEVKPTSCAGKNVVGMQIVGRGFDIYVVGGEYGLGTGRFNVDIWRYSTIAKNWYFVSKLPEPRRHMAVAFLNEKLIVVGGVGRHRLKLSTVDVYNIYTGKWTKAANVPEEFTSVPPVFVLHGKLLLYKSALYVYDPNEDSWTTRVARFRGPLPLLTKPIAVQFLMVHEDVVYVVDADGTDRSCIWVIDDLSSARVVRMGGCMTLFNNQVANGAYLIGFSHFDGTVAVEVIEMTNDKDFATNLVYREKTTQVRDLCYEAPVGCFNICNPSSLYDRLVLANSNGE